MDVRRSSRANKFTASMAIDSDSSDSSDLDASDEATAMKRPKLRTRRALSLPNEEEIVDVDEPVVKPKARNRIDIEKYESEEEEEEIDEDEDQSDELEASSADEVSEIELPERRSSRARKKVDHFALSDDDDVEYVDKPKRQKAKMSKSNGSSRELGNKTKRKRSKSSESENDYIVVGGSDGDDENGFVIDKVLAREVHTMKEWGKMCHNNNTRFLQHGSIFLEDEDEAKEKSQDDDVVMTDANGKEITVSDGKPKDAEIKAAVDENGQMQEGERFLVKWKNLSYLHVSWETEKALLEVDKNAKGKLQRFREKELSDYFAETAQGDEYFSPEYRIVDRILDIQDRPGDEFGNDDDDQKWKYFLVKWKALPYNQITWEREDDVDDDAAVKLYDERLLSAATRLKRMASTSSSQQRKNRKTNFRGYSAAKPPPFRKDQQFELRDYQLTGVNWLLFNWYQQRNSMLADEMGLGKTVQTVTFINHLAVVERLSRPYLIVAPLSTLGHWQREFNTWTELNAVVYHGTAEARQIIQDYEFFLSKDELARAETMAGGKDNHTKKQRSALPKLKKPCYRFDVLITTYEMCCTADSSKLANVDWQLLVVDEAHRLKNRNSKLSTIIHKNFSYENVLLLTGTPLQNNVEELWTLLNFLDHNKFNSMSTFLESYGDLKDSAQVERLHSELKPLLLRRMKEDVEKSLAPKEETIIEVELTVLQKQYYRAIFERNTEFLARGRKKAHTPSLMNIAMELRKCCNHPFLIKGVEELEIHRIEQQQNLSDEEREQHIRELLVTSSGKLVLLDKLLPRLRENGHRVLIFSQFKIMLDIIQDYLRFRSYHSERIDGNITGNDRQAAIDRFCEPNSSSFVMLLSTRAGGVGINLTAADTVIIYDSDWNPQNDLQAQARCHRIGQKKSVKIYRLLSSKTYELHMFHQSSLKLGLDQAVLGGIRTSAATLTGDNKGGAKSNASMRLSKEEIESLLKHGAYEMFKEEKEGEAEAASKRFSEESIDQILSRSKTIVHDPKADEGKEKKSLMSSFSKATFVSSTNPDEEVAIDDPDFWTKVVGLNAVEAKPVEPSPLKKRRCRRQVKSYVQQYDSGDEFKKAKRSRKAAMNPDNEEFVISESDDDDDDDTDDFFDEQLGDDGKKKRKSKILPIHIHMERISDLLTTFGYGRWNEMRKKFPALSAYPVETLKRYSQEYIASCIRVAGASFIITQVEQNHTAEGAAVDDQIGVAVNKFAQRFQFVSMMLKDMSIPSVSMIMIPDNLRSMDVSIKAERDANAKLLQLDRMYYIQRFIMLKILPAGPMVSLINDLQRLRDPSEVKKIIASGIPPKSSHNGAAAMTNGDVEAKSVPSTKATTPRSSSTDDANANANTETANAPSANIPADPTILATNDQTETSAETSDITNKSMNTPVAPTTQTTEDQTEKFVLNNDVTNEKNSCEYVSKNGTSNGNTAGEVESNSNATSENTDGTDVSNNEVTIENSGGGYKANAEINVSSQHTAHTVSEPTHNTDAMTEQAERKRALWNLQSLQDIGNAESVAPWWNSLIDDVILILYVFMDGWIKSRSLPNQLVTNSSLFGERAAAYPSIHWPTTAVLNRRVKLLISAWMVDRRSNLASVKTKTHTPILPSMQPSLPSQPMPSSSHVGSAIQTSTPSTKNAYMVTKHNSFAKIVFTYGIPDVRTCRDEQERREKWRYFLQDSSLDLAKYPLEELLIEALDLEKTCRSRLNSSLPGENEQRDIDRMKQDSLLGGKRGFWMLTSTQCRRLLHRIDLFRLLRSQILVLPPNHLIEVVGHVVSNIRADNSNNDYPQWWNSPRHDILLLQGVECYGLDEHLIHVWRLPLFSVANPVGPFPSNTWVENYVSLLAVRSRNILVKARKVAKKERMATLNRVRNIQGMRSEDPHFTPLVRLRQLIESNATTESEQEISKNNEPTQSSVIAITQSNANNASSSPMKIATWSQEVDEMKKEDPYFSERVRQVWSQQVVEEEIMSAKQRAELTVSCETDRKGDFLKAPDNQSATAIGVSDNREDLDVAVIRVNNSPTSDVQRNTNSLDNRQQNSTIRQESASHFKRKRPIKSWEVIVIDDSDDEEEESKRVTRSRTK